MCTVLLTWGLNPKGVSEFGVCTVSEPMVLTGWLPAAGFAPASLHLGSYFLSRAGFLE